MSGRAEKADADMLAMHGRARRAQAFATSLEDIHPLLHRLELQAHQLGLAVAPLYLASARGSLRHVHKLLLHQFGPDLSEMSGRELCPGTSLHLRKIADRDGVGERFLIGQRRMAPAERRETASWAGRPDLGAALLSSAQAANLCDGPVGAGLLFDALARHRWLHRASGAKWSTDVSGAHALVTAMTGGCGFPHPGDGATGGLIDREVAELLSQLGWLRMVSASMPGDPT
ncbi:hypothetical protein ACGGKE_10445 [Sphingobium naphthae]|uniref:hypothetical protein n=1 Tax=Sphingobium naphthae TaxID=1886786 RepID=UPI0037492B0F